MQISDDTCPLCNERYQTRIYCDTLLFIFNRPTVSDEGRWIQNHVIILRTVLSFDHTQRLEFCTLWRSHWWVLLKVRKQKLEVRNENSFFIFHLLADNRIAWRWRDSQENKVCWTISLKHFSEGRTDEEKSYHGHIQLKMILW